MGERSKSSVSLPPVLDSAIGAAAASAAKTYSCRVAYPAGCSMPTEKSPAAVTRNECTALCNANTRASTESSRSSMAQRLMAVACSRSSRTMVVAREA